MHLSKTREDRISNSYPQRDNSSCRNMTLFYDIGQLQRLERLDVIGKLLLFIVVVVVVGVIK